MTTAPALSLPSQLTFADAKACAQQLEKNIQSVALQSSAQSITLDASQVERFDSSALAVLMQLRRHVIKKQYTGIMVKNMPPKLRALTKLYGVAPLFPDAGDA